MNPLAHRIVAVLDANNQGEVNFREFVRALSVFSEGATAEAKIKCSSPAQRCPAWAVARDSHVALPTSAVAFGIYDVDGDGFISEADLLEVLQALIGSNMDEARLKVSSACAAPVGLVVIGVTSMLIVQRAYFVVGVLVLEQRMAHTAVTNADSTGEGKLGLADFSQVCWVVWLPPQVPLADSSLLALWFALQCVYGPDLKKQLTISFL